MVNLAHLKSNKSYYDKIIIGTLIIVISTCFFLRITNHTLIGDEFNYSFVCGNVNPETNTSKIIETYSDVCTSMHNHYYSTNGRIPVHFLEQCFTGIWGITAFAICDIIVFWISVILFIFNVSSEITRNKALIYASTILFMFYIFPSPHAVWTSINLAMNYLWPSCAALAVLAILKINPRINILRAILLSLLGLFLGWSNEAIAFPMAGLLFLSYVWRPKDFKGAVTCIAIPLWVACLIMLVAPGNWNRVGNSGSILNIIMSYPSIALMTWPLFIIGLIFIILLVYKRTSALRFIKNNLNICLLYIISFCFSIVAHTAPHSLIFEYITTMLMLGILLIPIISKFPVKASYVLAGIATIFISIQQIGAVKAEIDHTKICENIFLQYETSNDGIVGVPRMTGKYYGGKRFIYQLQPTAEQGANIWEDWNIHYGLKKKPIFGIPMNLYEDIYKKGQLISGQKVDGNTAFRQYGETFIIPKDSIPIEASSKVIATFAEPKSLIRRILPHSKKNEYNLIYISTPIGELAIIDAPERIYKIKQIHWKK